MGIHLEREEMEEESHRSQVSPSPLLLLNPLLKTPLAQGNADREKGMTRGEAEGKIKGTKVGSNENEH